MRREPRGDAGRWRWPDRRDRRAHEDDPAPIHHWARGGPTTLSNLALLCRRHHRAVHEEGFQIEREPDGALRFRRPNGWTIPDVPAPPMLPRDPIDTLLNENVALGLRLGPHTMTPGWLGERLDVAWAIDVLHPLALAERPEGRLRHSLDEPLGVADA